MQAFGECSTAKYFDPEGYSTLCSTGYDCKFSVSRIIEAKTNKSYRSWWIAARLLKYAANVIAKPIAYLINLTISNEVIPSEWKEDAIGITQLE